MHRKVKGLLSLVLTIAMVTVSAAPAFAEELPGEQPVEEQPIVEMVETEPEPVQELDIVEAETVPAEVQLAEEPASGEIQTEMQTTGETEPVVDPSTEQNITEETGAETDPEGEQQTEELPVAEITNVDPVSEEAPETGAESALSTDAELEEWYNRLLTEEQKKFKVYSGNQPLSELTADADILSKLTFMSMVMGVTPDSESLDIQSGTLVKALLLDYRQGDFNFYSLRTWNIWSVDSNGAPQSVIASSSSLKRLATKGNFLQSAHIKNNGIGTDPQIEFQNPILEPVWSCINYEIPVYDADGNDTGVSVTVNAENYNNLSFPDMDADAWKLTYAGTEIELNAASEIWTNQTNGIRTIGRDFDESQARLQPVVLQPVLQEGTAEFVQPDWYEGQPMAAPVVSSETNGIENITYYYKETGADDSTYTTAVPEKAGAYTAMAVFAATAEYQQVIRTAEFHILPELPVTPVLKEGTAEFTQPDWYEGQPMAAPVVSSETNGTDNIIYFYKEAEADDSTYTTTVPEKAGAYMAAAVFAATEEYEQVIRTASFHILPAIPDTPELKEGSAEFAQPDWYEGQPMAAPVVSSETNGIENITYFYKEAGADDSTYTTTVPEKAGAYTAAAVFAATEEYKEVIKFADFNILPNVPAEEPDNAAPIISGVSDGETCYGDQIITVTDEHLKMVTVNGEAVAITDNRAEVTLRPSEEVYKIAAADEAGNKVEYTIEVLETWVRDGINENGKKKLRGGRIYKLGSGQWTVDGDSTVYNSGSFYVKSGGEYDFKRK